MLYVDQAGIKEIRFTYTNQQNFVLAFGIPAVLIQPPAVLPHTAGASYQYSIFRYNASLNEHELMSSVTLDNINQLNETSIIVSGGNGYFTKRLDSSDIFNFSTTVAMESEVKPHVCELQAYHHQYFRAFFAHIAVKNYHGNSLNKFTCDC